MAKAEIDFFSAKTFPAEKHNPDIIFCGSASIKVGGFAMNEIKLKYNKKTGKYLIQFPKTYSSDGKYRPAYCTITKESHAEAHRLIVRAAQKAWGQLPEDA